MTLLNSHLCTKLSYFNKEYVLMKMKKMYMTHRNVFEKSEKKRNFCTDILSLKMAFLFGALLHSGSFCVKATG